MEGKYYYHGTDLKSLESIFNNYGIKCRRMIEEENIDINRTLDVTFGIGYNGLEYISLCKLNNDSFSEDSAYDTFIHDNYCLILAGNIPALKTMDLYDPLVKEQYKNEITYFVRNRDKSILRFSDMKDEWQVKTFIPFKDIIGIGIPLRRESRILSKQDKKRVNDLLQIAYILGLDIVDTSNYKFALEYEEEKSTSEEVVKIRKITR